MKTGERARVGNGRKLRLSSNRVKPRARHGQSTGERAMTLLRDNSLDPHFASLVARLFADGTPATLTDDQKNPVVAVRRHVEQAARSEPLTIVAVEGEIDAHTAPLLLAVLRRALPAGNVCCDLNGVSFLAAAGVNALFAAHLHAAACGQTLSCRGARGFAARVLALVDPAGLIPRQR
jgi:anti-anti-sigma factor